MSLQLPLTWQKMLDTILKKLPLKLPRKFNTKLKKLLVRLLLLLKFMLLKQNYTILIQNTIPLSKMELDLQRI
jgi:hypothetical protein